MIRRTRYIFVPKFVSRDEKEPVLIQNDGLAQFKEVADKKNIYKLNKIQKMPDVDAHVLPDQNLNDEAFRLYHPIMP